MRVDWNAFQLGASFLKPKYMTPKCHVVNKHLTLGNYTPANYSVSVGNKLLLKISAEEPVSKVSVLDTNLFNDFKT